MSRAFVISTTRRSRISGDASRAAFVMTNLFKLPTWADKEHVYAVVETPRGSTCKLDFDPELKVFTLAKPLMAGLTYPYDWGFIPSTQAEDGDSLQADRGARTEANEKGRRRRAKRSHLRRTGPRAVRRRSAGHSSFAVQGCRGAGAVLQGDGRARGQEAQVSRLAGSGRRRQADQEAFCIVRRDAPLAAAATKEPILLCVCWRHRESHSCALWMKPPQ